MKATKHFGGAALALPFCHPIITLRNGLPPQPYGLPSSYSLLPSCISDNVTDCTHTHNSTDKASTAAPYALLHEKSIHHNKFCTACKLVVWRWFGGFSFPGWSAAFLKSCLSWHGMALSISFGTSLSVAFREFLLYCPMRDFGFEIVAEEFSISLIWFDDRIPLLLLHRNAPILNVRVSFLQVLQKISVIF